jgi:hypothetical protein
MKEAFTDLRVWIAILQRRELQVQNPKLFAVV